MDNKEAVERFDQAHGAKIEKLFWIAAAMGSSDFKEFMEYLQDDDWQELFPEIHDSEYFQEYIDDGDEMQALVDFGMFGLIAEVHLPECRNFHYKDGKPVGWSVHHSVCRIRYIYAETLEGLMAQVEKVSGEEFQKFIEKDHKKKVAKN